MHIKPDSELGFRGLTVKQPWAGLIASGEKTIEYRSWGTDYRGDILITASANPAERGYPKAELGCAVCVVRVVDTIWPVQPSAQNPDMLVEWILADPRPVKRARVKGKLQLWPVPAELAERIGVTL